MSFELVGKGCSISANTIRNWWQVSAQELGVSLGCSDASRPGYFFIQRGRSPRNNDFVIYCPNPKCELVGTAWSETYPGGHRCPVPTPFEVSPGQADRVAIPALTVDDQVFGFPPTVLLATVDKFARLAFEPRAATIFGNCERFHPREGFYRRHCVRDDDRLEPAHAGDGLAVAVLPPPDLVLQDELHLVDGPLGSMVGLYESVIDGLIRRTHPPKYIASTATVREAEVQVKSLFNRSLCQFPAAGLRAEDNFFALIGAGNPFQEKGSGRLYLGMCGFGRGALTPLVRIWAVLLQTLEELRKAGCPAEQFDPYWTPVGYFNSITQLATVSGLWRQYIPQRMQNLSNEPRDIGDAVELSSRMESQRLPLILSHLGRPYPQAPSGVLATSMFGTGVDVSRLSLMVVHGQPKTTSSYIQATGRVGREVPGLVVVAFAPTRPRELNHYEYFTGYHQQLYRGVEPVNVYPFAPRARERGMGPALVAWQRQCPNAIEGWRRDARVIADESLEEGFGLMLERSQSQPEMRRPDALEVRGELQDCQQKWQKVACEQLDLEYQENTLMRSPSKPVVLGDEQHQRAGLPVVFRNAPQSLREVEATTGFRV